MIKAFKVAGHTFHLELKDDSSLWPRLTQYDSFVTDPVTDPLFTLRLNQNMSDSEEELKVMYDADTEPGETVVKLLKADSFWQIEMAQSSDHPVCGITRTSLDFREAELKILSHRMSDAIFAVNNSLMLLYAFTTACKGTLEMHASVIMNDGKGYLFLAKSGTGKSTHSQLWLDNIPGSELLNDDNPIVRVWPDGKIIVYGSPWSGKTPCYRNIECPVGAFVQIRRNEENKISVLPVLEAYILLYSSSSGFKADSAMSDGLHESLEACIENCKNYVLDCRPDAEAAVICSNMVKNG